MMGENFWCPKGILRRYIQSHKFDALTSNQKINLIKCIVISVPNVRTAEDLLRTALFGKTAECRLRHSSITLYMFHIVEIVTRVGVVVVWWLGISLICDRGARDVQMTNPRRERGTLNPLLLFYFQCSIFYILGKTEFFHFLYIGLSSILSPLGFLFLLLWSFLYHWPIKDYFKPYASKNDHFSQF